MISQFSLFPTFYELSNSTNFTNRIRENLYCLLLTQAHKYHSVIDSAIGFESTLGKLPNKVYLMTGKDWPGLVSADGQASLG